MEETKEISKALMCDSELQAMYNDLKTTIEGLDRDKMEPSSSSILNILAYSRSIRDTSLKSSHLNISPSHLYATTIVDL